MDQPTEEAHQLLFLSFRILGENYGLPIMRVREIMELPPMTRVPQTPTHVRGLVNIRGSIVPILDLAPFFGCPSAPATRDTCVVVVECASGGRERLYGLVVDSVHEVVELSADTVIEPPTFGERARIEALAGLVPTKGGLLLLLDADRLFSADQLLSFEQRSDSVARPSDAPEGACLPAPSREDQRPAAPAGTGPRP